MFLVQRIFAWQSLRCFFLRCPDRLPGDFNLANLLRRPMGSAGVFVLM
jgi:hypothetical protein